MEERIYPQPVVPLEVKGSVIFLLFALEQNLETGEKREEFLLGLAHNAPLIFPFENKFP